MAGARARFGAPLELDLGGRGIRSLERVGTGYWVVAGPIADKGRFALYRWSGQAGEKAIQVAGIALGSLRPEAVFEVPGTTRLQVLSDDGGVVRKGVECKRRPASERSFRSVVISP